MKKENRSIQDYQRLADNYDIQAFIDGRAIEPIDVYDYVVDNMDWLNEADFLNETARLQSLGHPELDSFILAAMNFSKYPPITLAELDTYIEIPEEEEDMNNSNNTESYVLNTEHPEKWGPDAFNGMTISKEEVNRLSREWDISIEDLMKDLTEVPASPRSMEEYVRMAEDYDIDEFINGRKLKSRDIINFVAEKMPSVKMHEFMETTISLLSMEGNCQNPIGCLLVALLDYTRDWGILAELDKSIEV